MSAETTIFTVLYVLCTFDEAGSNENSVFLLICNTLLLSSVFYNL